MQTILSQVQQIPATCIWDFGPHDEIAINSSKKKKKKDVSLYEYKN